jgi:hypothetical protein
MAAGAAGQQAAAPVARVSQGKAWVKLVQLAGVLLLTLI